MGWERTPQTPGEDSRAVEREKKAELEKLAAKLVAGVARKTGLVDAIKKGFDRSVISSQEGSRRLLKDLGVEEELEGRVARLSSSEREELLRKLEEQSETDQEAA